MKTTKFYCFALGLLLLSNNDILAQEKLANDSIEPSHKDDRNVMLNAANNTGPREINIGLPSNVGGTTILENDLPVVYFYWPELPFRTWRNSVSLSQSGLLGLREASITSGDFGFPVNSYTRLGGDKHEVIGKLSSSNFGWLHADVNVSGPLGKGWHYTAGVYLNYDPTSLDLKFTKYLDKTQIFRAGITKRVDKGEISLLYKYSQSTSLTNYAVFKYKEGGEVEEVNGFKIGRDAFIARDGEMRFLDMLTGEYYNVDLSKMDDTKIASHNIDLLGNYKMGNDWKFKFIMRYHNAKASAFNNIVPTAVLTGDKAQGFTYEDGTPYNGPVQKAFATHSRKSPVHSFQSRFEFLKSTDDHNWRLGLREDYFNEDRFAFNRSFYYQEIAANPRRLYTDDIRANNGYFDFNQGTPYHAGKENKVTTYFTDHWTPLSILDLDYGLNLRHHYMKGDYWADRTSNTTVGQTMEPFEHSWFHLGANVSAVLKITDKLGINSNFIYTEKNRYLEDYSGQVAPGLKKSKTPYVDLGVYFNHPLISIVSSISYITQSNYQARLNLVNPENEAEVQFTPVAYGIQTIGWTTDIIAKPFRGFNLHALLTIQDPVYKDYKINAFNKVFDFEGKNVTQISKVLIEIDPSYTTPNDKFRFWLSARYFSKQYANLSNVLYFKGWWETFGGVNYKINKNLGVDLTFVNLLGQNGAKGAINGSELITDPSKYYGQIMTSAYIRPFTVEGSIKFNF